MNLRVTDTFKNYLAVTLVVMITILLSSTAGGQASVGADFDFAELIRETIVYGSITRDTPAYDDYASGRRQIGEFKEGEVVEIVRDRAFAWYLVKSEDGQQGWVSADSLSIPGDPETNMEQLPQAVLEAFVNTGGLSSKTDHLVWVIRSPVDSCFYRKGRGMEPETDDAQLNREEYFTYLARQARDCRARHLVFLPLLRTGRKVLGAVFWALHVSLLAYGRGSQYC